MARKWLLTDNNEVKKLFVFTNVMDLIAKYFDGLRILTLMNDELKFPLCFKWKTL